MTPEELKALLDQVSKQVQTELRAAASGFITPEMLSEKLATLEGDKKTIDELKSAVEKQGMEMLKIMGGGPESNPKSIKQLVSEKKSELESISKTGSGKVTFDIPLKAAFDTPVVTTDVSGNTTAMRLPGVNQLATLKPVLSNIFNHVALPPEMNNAIRYWEQVAATRSAAGRSEGGAFAESKLTWIERTVGLQEIADAVPVSKESLKFVSFVAQELNNLLTTNIVLKEDEYIWDGNGTPPISTGLVTYATEFAAAAYAASTKFKFKSANIFDLVMAMATDLENGKEGKFKADFVLMNRGNSISAKGSKNDFSSYLMPPFVTPDGKIIDGLTVIESSQVDLGTILIGDSTKATIYDGENLTVEMGYIEDQFVKGALTLRAYKRMALIVKELDKAGFMKCTDIPTALTAIQEVNNG